VPSVLNAGTACATGEVFTVTCSSVTPAQIDAALDRLAALINDELVLSTRPKLDL
jgi:hypothetical protein